MRVFKTKLKEVSVLFLPFAMLFAGIAVGLAGALELCVIVASHRLGGFGLIATKPIWILLTFIWLLASLGISVPLAMRLKWI